MMQEMMQPRCHAARLAIDAVSSGFRALAQAFAQLGKAAPIANAAPDRHSAGKRDYRWCRKMITKIM
jgi:hypothetical protein